MDFRKHLTLKTGAAALLSLLFVGTPAYANESEHQSLPRKPSVEACTTRCGNHHR